jgi:hypothetical protein
MSSPVPMNANQYIERQLDDHARDLERRLNSHVMSFNGSLIGGVDDAIRAAVEQRTQRERTRDKLTMCVTTFGGYIQIVHRIVDTLRYHYKIVDFIIPNYAFSAGTVLAMSGDAIHMDYYSRLGPIDPQVEIENGRLVPALGYLIQWERLLKKARQGKITLPEVQLMVDKFDQAELYQYEQERELSIALLKEWLAKYKFKNWTKTATRGIVVTDGMRKKRAAEIAKELNNTERWHVHGHGISMDVLRRDLNLMIDDFGQNATLSSQIRCYSGLLDDYMTKTGQQGVLHTVGVYVPFPSISPSVE